MRLDTIPIQSGFETDPTTKAVAVPIYKKVGYAFNTVDHKAVLFKLEAGGDRYTRVSNPSTGVLERRIVALAGGLEALCQFGTYRDFLFRDREPVEQ